jgi:hypothetical protein
MDAQKSIRTTAGLSFSIFDSASALALLAGAVCVQLLTQLPPRGFDIALAVAGIVVVSSRTRW